MNNKVSKKKNKSARHSDSEEHVTDRAICHHYQDQSWDSPVFLTYHFQYIFLFLAKSIENDKLRRITRKPCTICCDCLKIYWFWIINKKTYTYIFNCKEKNM